MSDKPTSLKQAFQQMIPEDIGLIEGIVTSTSPLSIQIVNNPKMVVSGANLVVPRHLTDYETACTINLCSPSVLSGETDMADEHYHTNPEGGNTGTQPEHNHALDSFGLSHASITIHNSLKKGEKVYLLRFNGGKQYYVLDRVVG